MDLELSGKKALITGASRGLGYATAHLLAAEGVNLCINSRDEERIINAAKRITSETNSEVKVVSGDVTNPSAVKEIVSKAAELLGGLDILITNSGGPPAKRFEDISEETWYQAIELSFMSHVRLIKEALPFLRRGGQASVLTITSYSVKQPIPNLILSNSIRAATVGLTKSLALELGSEGIRFNSILPAWTKTERVTELLSYRAETYGTSILEEAQKIAQESPLGRLAEVHEFAKVAVFLVSPAASYMTGSMLSVDGGMYKGVF